MTIDSTPSLHSLRKIAWTERKQRVIESKEPSPEGEILFAIVTPDNGGKGTDPDGKLAAATVFANGWGMTLAEVAEALS